MPEAHPGYIAPTPPPMPERERQERHLANLQERVWLARTALRAAEQDLAAALADIDSTNTNPTQKETS